MFVLEEDPAESDATPHWQALSELAWGEPPERVYERMVAAGEALDAAEAALLLETDRSELGRLVAHLAGDLAILAELPACWLWHPAGIALARDVVALRADQPPRGALASPRVVEVAAAAAALLPGLRSCHRHMPRSSVR